MKDIFTLYNEQNPPEKKPSVAENVVMRNTQEEQNKVVERKEQATEPKTEPKTEQKTEQPAEQKTEQPAETQKGGVENAVDNVPAATVSA